jgi:hypothetical protein
VKDLVEAECVRPRVGTLEGVDTGAVAVEERAEAKQDDGCGWQAVEESRAEPGATITSRNAAASESQNARACEAPRSIGTAVSSSPASRSRIEAQPSRDTGAAPLVFDRRRLEALE